MKNRWVSLLFFLLIILIVSLSWHLFVSAKTTAAANLIIDILKPLNILLVLTLFFILSRNLFKLYFERKKKIPGFRLRTKLVLAILPITLVPSLILFTLATRSVDNIFLNAVIDSNVSKIIRNSEAMRTDFLGDIARLHTQHGPDLLKLLENGDLVRVQAYLNRYALQGLEWYDNDQLRNRVMAAEAPVEQLFLLQNTARRGKNGEPILVDDGRLLIRFPYIEKDQALYFLYTRETPFTQRFLFIRDSYTYLNYTLEKTEILKGINQSILLIATLAIIFGGIWTGLAFARRFLAAFKVLIQGAEQVSRGNFDTQLQLTTGDEVEDVVKAFNSMTRTLKSNQTELEQKALDLQQVNDELSDQSQYTQTILQETNAGILSTDKDDRIRTINRAAQRLLGLERIEVGTDFEKILDSRKHQQLLYQWREFKLRGNRAIFRQLELVDRDNEMTLFLASNMLSLQKDGRVFGSLIVLEDLTQLHNAQKVAAWREVAKRVAHEIKNPLTPIQLSIQRIHRKAEKGASDLKTAIQSGYETIMSETALLKNLVNEFSTFAKMPSPNKSEVNLNELVSGVCSSYEAVYPHVRVRANLPSEEHRLLCDSSQMRQVLSNLIHNGAQATRDSGTITVGFTRESNQYRLWVSDEGTGIPQKERSKVFLPYYSKSVKGTGLGLAIVKRIVEDHGGHIHIEDNQPRGTRFIISLPLA